MPDPARVPSYLLIVGSPEDIPFEFQYGLSIQYRVGRLHFDTIEEYRNYAESIVSVERGDMRASRRATFFGPRHALDQATAIGNEQLLAPLSSSTVQAFPTWSVDNISGAQATAETLRSLFGGRRPDYLFSVSHGMAFSADRSEQRTSQGAILCSDWPGLGAPVQKAHYFAASDVDLAADLRGLQLFFFAEYSAGTDTDCFQSRPTSSTARPFVSPLVQRLLGKPNGAAAVLGHVDRAWTFSFSWPGAGPQIQTFVNAVGTILSGLTIGLAHQHFSIRYAELAAMRTSEHEPEPAVRNRQIATIDARNYVVIGDPATRIVLDG